MLGKHLNSRPNPFCAKLAHKQSAKKDLDCILVIILTLTFQELAEENDEGCGGDIGRFVCGVGADLL